MGADVSGLATRKRRRRARETIERSRTPSAAIALNTALVVLGYSLDVDSHRGNGGAEQSAVGKRKWSIIALAAGRTSP